MIPLLNWMNAHPRLVFAVMIAVAALLFYLTVRRAIREERRYQAIFGTPRRPRSYDEWSAQ